MSLVKANTYQDASGGSNAVFSGVASPPNSMGFRNRIINGNMVIDQRNAGASVTANDDIFPIDRWKFGMSQSSKGTSQRSTTAPAGFTNSLLFTSSSAYSVLSSDSFVIRQLIEGLNFADLGWGAAGAQSVTLSFWVRSSLTGTFGVVLSNNAQNRCYPVSYTISAANTFEYKTITVPGDTTGTWLTDTGVGLRVNFGLGVGSTFSGASGSWSSSTFTGVTGATSVVGTNGATFYITGVQLEAGTNASAFEQIDYGRELAMCQRYFWRSNTSNTTGIGGFYGGFHNTTTFSSVVKWPVTMRAAPTFTRGGTSDNFYVPGISATLTATTVTPSFTVDGAWTEFTSASPTAGLGYTSAYNGQLSVSAEL